MCQKLYVLQSHATPGSIGGSERSLQLAISGLHDLGISSGLLCAEIPNRTGWERVKGTIITPEFFEDRPASPWHISHGIRTLLKRIRETDPDVVHIHYGLRPQYIEAIAQVRPTVFTAHLPLCPNGARYHYRYERICENPVGLGCLAEGYRNWGCGFLSSGERVSAPAFTRATHTTILMLKALHRCRYVIAPSEWQRGMLVSDGLPKSRVLVIPPAVEAEHRPPDDQRSDVCPVVAVVSRLVRFKGIEHAIRASASVEVPHKLWIIGDGPDMTRLRQVAQELNSGQRTVFLSAVDPERVSHMLRQVSIVLIPSLCPETFNMAGVEAAESGCRVLVYDSAGTRQWSSAYPNVTRIPYKDWGAMATEMARILSSSVEGESRNGYPEARFSTASHAEALRDVYERASREGPGA